MEDLIQFQQNEITEFHVYNNLAKLFPKNKKVLKSIARDEKKHYLAWKKYTEKEVSPNKLKIWLYTLIARIFGLTFAIKFMEGGEKSAQEVYTRALKKRPEIEWIIHDEEKHERELIGLVDEEKVKYISSMVLGVNDALVEISGTLAGLTFALQNTQLVGLAGAITGIAATLSMAASEFLSQKSEGGKNPLRAAFYTGLAYLFAVFFMVSPYFLLKNPLLALTLTLTNVVAIIFIFTGYTSVVQEKPFKREFLSMVTISLSVSAISFLIGMGARQLLGIDV